MSKILIELKGKVSKIFTSITHMNPYTKGFLDGMFMIIAIVCICRMPIINIKDSGYSFSNVDRIINVIHLLLIRDGDIQPLQFRGGVNNLHQIFYRWNLEIHILCVDSFVLEFLVEISLRERMNKRITDKSVFVHILTIYFSARYIVQMPKVSRLNEAFWKPALWKASTICSPCGKASIVAVR